MFKISSLKRYLSKSSSCFPYILLVTAFALNHINHTFRVASDVASNRSYFTGGME